MYCESRVLQQRIEVGTVERRRRQSHERVRRQQREQQESSRQQTEDADDTSSKGIREIVAEATDRDGPCRQQQDPKQQRPLVSGPHSRYLVHGRQGQLRVIRDVGNRKITLQKCPHEAAEGTCNEDKLPVRCNSAHSHHRGIISMRTDERQNRLTHGQRQCEDQRKMPDLRDHCGAHSDERS